MSTTTEGYTEWTISNISPDHFQLLSRSLEKDFGDKVTVVFFQKHEGVYELKFSKRIQRELIVSHLHEDARQAEILPPIVGKVDVTLKSEWVKLLKKHDIDLDRVAKEFSTKIWHSKDGCIGITSGSLKHAEAARNKLQEIVENILSEQYVGNIPNRLGNTASGFGSKLDSHVKFNGQDRLSNGFASHERVNGISGLNANGDHDYNSQRKSHNGSHANEYHHGSLEDYENDRQTKSLGYLLVNGDGNNLSERDKFSSGQRKSPENISDQESDKSQSSRSSNNKPQLYMADATTKKSNSVVVRRNSMQRISDHITTESVKLAKNSSASSTGSIDKPQSFSTTKSTPRGKKLVRSSSVGAIRRSCGNSRSADNDILTPQTKLLIRIAQGDITGQTVEAIVNPANSYLVHSGGAAKAIASAAGVELEKECKKYIRKYGSLRIAKPIDTTAGNLKPIKYVIHIVGPRLDDCNGDKNKCRELLEEAFFQCFCHANKLQVNSVAIPAISSGSFGVPKDAAADAAYSALMNYDSKMASNQRRYLKEILFVNIDKESTKAFKIAFAKLVKPTSASTRDDSGITMSHNWSSTVRTANSENIAVRHPSGSNASSVAPIIRSNSRGTPCQASEKISQRGLKDKVMAGQNLCPNCRGKSVINKRTDCSHKCCVTCSKTVCRKCSDFSANEDMSSTVNTNLISADIGNRQVPHMEMRSKDNGEPYWTPIDIDHGAFSSLPITLADIDKRSSADKPRQEDIRHFMHNTNSPHARTPSPLKNDCVICMSAITDPKPLACGHVFCRDCIDECFKRQKKCPMCGRIFGSLTGNQPNGTMKIRESYMDVSGYPGCGSIEITYEIPSGIQTAEHQNPGELYKGATRSAYLPNNSEGKEVCELLKQAFDAKLIFTVGKSTTTGKDNCVTWNDIHHKTSYSGRYGYPDPTYLSRVKDELAAKGIVSSKSISTSDENLDASTASSTSTPVAPAQNTRRRSSFNAGDSSKAFPVSSVKPSADKGAYNSKSKYSTTRASDTRDSSSDSRYSSLNASDYRTFRNSNEADNYKSFSTQRADTHAYRSNNSVYSLRSHALVPTIGSSAYSTQNNGLTSSASTMRSPSVNRSRFNESSTNFRY